MLFRSTKPVSTPLAPHLKLSNRLSPQTNKETKELKLDAKDINHYGNSLLEHLSEKGDSKKVKIGKHMKFLNSIKGVLEMALDSKREISFVKISKFIEDKFNYKVSNRTIRNYFISELGYKSKPYNKSNKTNIDSNIQTNIETNIKTNIENNINENNNKTNIETKKETNIKTSNKNINKTKSDKKPTKSKNDNEVASVANVTKGNTKSKAKTNTKKEVKVKETKIEDSISAPKKSRSKKTNT